MRSETTLNTIQDAFNCESCSLFEITKADNTNLIAPLVVADLITDLNAFINVGHNLQPEQIKKTAQMIVADEHTRLLKPEDLKVCFNMMKKGLYGTFYDKLDGQTIFQCVYKYCVDKENYIYDRHEEIKRVEKIQSDAKNINPRILKTLVETAEELKKTNRQKNIDQSLSEPIKQKTEHEKKIQGYFADFDELQKQQRVTGSYVNYKGKYVTCSAYVELKLQEELRLQNDETE